MIYLPPYALKDAHFLHKKHGEMPLICGQLAHYDDTSENLAKIDDFFLSTTKKILAEKQQKIHFYDIILAERNIYYPSNFYHKLYAKLLLKNNNLNNFLQKGALFGFLHKHEFIIETSSIRYFGAFASVIAYKA